MQLKSDGLLSGIENPTQEHNRANVHHADLTFYAKGQLRNHIWMLELEAFYKQKKYDELLEKYRELRNKHLTLQTEFINRFPDCREEAYLKVG
jgi:hypothetical protein